MSEGGGSYNWDKQGKGCVILLSGVFNIDVFVSIYVTQHGNTFTLKVSVGSLITDVRLRSTTML